jgi:hypothetical protein
MGTPVRLLFIAAFFVVALLAAYAFIAIRSDPATSNIVNLLGPGTTPAQCEARMRPHFEKMRPTLTKVASTLRNSENFTSIMLAWTDDNSFIVTSDASKEYGVISTEDAGFDPEDFRLLAKSGYYAAAQFYKNDDGLVGSPLQANCGVPLYQWVRLKLGLGWSEGSEILPVASTALLFREEGFIQLNACPESVPSNDVPVFCEVPLTDNWVWALEYYDYGANSNAVGSRSE